MNIKYVYDDICLIFSLRNGKPLPTNDAKYTVTRNSGTGDAILKIVNTTITDSANYTLVASNGHLTKTDTFDLRIAGKLIYVNN